MITLNRFTYYTVKDIYQYNDKKMMIKLNVVRPVVINYHSVLLFC